MNQKTQKQVCDFYNSVWNYMKMEYKPKWARMYKSVNIIDDMIKLTAEYYFGGNTIPFTAAQIVDLLSSKYRA